MALLVLVACWVGVSAVVISLIRRYRSLQATSTVILLSVFLSWLLPISLTFLLPIDISSTRYEQCLLLYMDGIKRCTKSWLYIAAPIRHFTWLTVYWATFLLTWYKSVGAIFITIIVTHFFLGH